MEHNNQIAKINPASTLMQNFGERWSTISTALTAYQTTQIPTSSYALSQIEAPTMQELEDGTRNPSTGEGAMTQIILRELATYLQVANIKETFSPKQAMYFINDFLAMYPNDPVTFVKMFFFKARNGAFGKTYGSIDQPTLMQWYRDFRKETLDQVPALRKEPEHKALNADTEEPIPMPDDVKERLDKLMSNLGNGQTASKTNNPEQNKQKLIDKTRRQIIAQGLIPITDPDYVQKTNELINAKLAELGLI